MKFVSAVIFSFLFYQAAFAQVLDTIRESFHHKPKFYANLSSYNSIAQKQNAIFTDLIFGVSFNKRVYLGAGFTWLNSQVVSSQQITDTAGTYTTNARLQLTLFTTSAEYVFFRKYPWTFSALPYKVGIGNAYFQYVDRQTRALTNLDTQLVITYQPELYASYNILPWIGLGSSLGYRFTLFSSGRIHGDLDSFTYSIGVKLFLGAIYDSLFPNGICKRKETTPP